jgi:hypothetical protein
VLLLHEFGLPLAAQDSQAPLTVSVLAGQGLVNSQKQPAAQTLSVRVADIAGQPVVGALVLFTAPNYGPGGTFLDDLKSLQVTTDAHGVALANGFHANSAPGAFAINVKAIYGTQTGFATIQESNVVAGSSGLSRRTWWIIAAVAVAGAAGGTAAALHGSGSSSTAISPGGVTVGAPH